jgi:hypothetical protein
VANNGQIVARRMSPRLQDLLAAAMRFAALVELSVPLSESEARELAVLGDLDIALDRLRRRMTVRRVIPGTVNNEHSQVRLAVYEIAAEAIGGPEALQEVIRRGVAAETAAAAAESRATEKIRQLEKLFDERRAASAAEREFIRRASRLRVKQVNQLRMSIFDAEALERAIAGLDALYGKYLTDAIGPESATD